MFEATNGRMGAGSSRERTLQMIFNISQIDPVEAEQLGSALRFVRTELMHERISLAVLVDALTCMQKHRRSRIQKHREAYASARDWIQSDDVDWPFAYRTVCEALGIDPEYLRERVLCLYGLRSNSRRADRVSRITIYPLNIQRSAA